jgi:hypothetical protein
MDYQQTQLTLEINTTAKQAYYDGLPHIPLCTDDYSNGLKRLPRELAALKASIQHNPHSIARSLAFDIDNVNGYCHWSDVGAPAPNWIVVNPDNGHAHYIYMLACPVPLTDKAMRKPIAYLQRIERGLQHRLGADIGYVGLISKNPLSDAWKVENVHDLSYSLDELADYVDLDLPKLKKRETDGLGRNCILFDELRYWAYKQVTAARQNMAFSAWFELVLTRAEKFNTFDSPLHLSEIKATAKSVAKWTWKHYNGQGKVKRGRDAAQNTQLSLQEKQILSMHNTHKQRKEATQRKILDAVSELKAQGSRVSIRAVAKAAGVSKKTVENHKNIL